jgi:hypothetical protein
MERTLSECECDRQQSSRRRQRARAVVAPADVHVRVLGATLLGRLLAQLLIRRLRVLRRGSLGRGSRAGALVRAPDSHAHAKRRDCGGGGGGGDDDALQVLPPPRMSVYTRVSHIHPSRAYATEPTPSAFRPTRCSLCALADESGGGPTLTWSQSDAVDVMKTE